MPPQFPALHSRTTRAQRTEAQPAAPKVIPAPQEAPAPAAAPSTPRSRASRSTVATVRQRNVAEENAQSQGTQKRGWSLFGNRAEKSAQVERVKGTAAQKYDQYRKTIEDAGGKFRTGPDERNLLSIRTPTNAKANGGQGQYDDKTVMLWQDAKGNKYVQEYKSNTDPTNQYAGKNGYAQNPGRLQEGYHEFRSRLFHPDSSDSIKTALEPVGTVRYERLSAKDGESVVGGGRNTSFLFHSGAEDNTLSAGCQTMPPKEWARFWADIHAAGNPGTVGYTVVRK